MGAANIPTFTLKNNSISEGAHKGSIFPLLFRRKKEEEGKKNHRIFIS